MRHHLDPPILRYHGIEGRAEEARARAFANGNLHRLNRATQLLTAVHARSNALVIGEVAPYSSAD